MSVEPPMIVLEYRVCAGREAARMLVGSRPDVSPSGAVYLRCDRARQPADPRIPDYLLARLTKRERRKFANARGVEIMTPSFADELLKSWPHAQLVGASEDVQASFDFARDR